MNQGVSRSLQSCEKGRGQQGILLSCGDVGLDRIGIGKARRICNPVSPPVFAAVLSPKRQVGGYNSPYDWLCRQVVEPQRGTKLTKSTSEGQSPTAVIIPCLDGLGLQIGRGVVLRSSASKTDLRSQSVLIAQFNIQLMRARENTHPSYMWANVRLSH